MKYWLYVVWKADQNIKPISSSLFKTNEIAITTTATTGKLSENITVCRIITMISRLLQPEIVTAQHLSWN